MKHLVAAALLTVVAASAAQTARASDLAEMSAADGAWTMSAVETKRGEPWGAALIAAGETGETMGFRCDDGALLVAFALEPTDLMRAFTEAGPQKSVEVTLAVNEAAPQAENWLYLRRHGVVASADAKTARRLYNAAVRGEPISVDADKRGGGVYRLPAADAAAFGDFMTTCGFSARGDG